MDYIKKTYTDKAVEVQISSFAGKGGVTEYHVLKIPIALFPSWSKLH